MIKRIVTLVNIGFIVIVLLSLSGCCGKLCEMERLNGERIESTSNEDTGMDGGGVDLLTIQLPFVNGYNSLCTQGANGDYSHHGRSTRYDADFDTPNNARDVVYAPVGGIAYAHDESRTKNYGNHVTIDQNDGTYIIIAHMDEILVADGEEVAAGQIVGYEGHTGMADGDHVHIGRHSGDAKKMGEYGTSVNALAFNATDKTLGTTVTKMTTELTCDLSTGHTYTSLLPTPKWHPSGSLLKLPDASTVYLLNGFTLEPFLTEDSFTSRNYSWDDVVLMDSSEKSCYMAGNTISGTSLVTAVYDTVAYTGAWLIVGAASDPNRYRAQLTSVGAEAVLATWGISATSLSSLPSPSAAGVTLSAYPTKGFETATFRDGSLVSTNEASDVYVMEGGAAIPVMDWDTYLLMGFAHRTVHELPKRDFDTLVDIVGSCTTDSYCIANNDVTTCGGDTEDVPGTYPGEGTGTGGTETEEGESEEEGETATEPVTPGTGVGLELWWVLDTSADWMTISGEFTNESNYGYGWSSNITWSTWSNELYFAIVDAGPGDSFRYSYGYNVAGVDGWGCVGPFPPGDTTGTFVATYNGSALTVNVVEDPNSDGCGLEVRIP